LIINLFIPKAQSLAAGCDGPEIAIYETIDSAIKYEYKNCTSGDNTLGILESRSATTQKLIDRISNLPPTPCKIGSIAPFKKYTAPNNKRFNLLTFCSHDAGKSNTLSVFSNGNFIENINYETSIPKIEWNNEANIFVSALYRTTINQQGSTSSTLITYIADPKTYPPKLAPRFNKDYNDLHKNQYEYLKSSSTQENIKYLLQPMLASLSTLEQKKICKELSTPPLQPIPEPDISSISESNERHGFIKISKSSCK